MQVTPFNFDKYQVRTVRHDTGEVWFVAQDVCEALSLDDTSKAVSRLDDDERGTNSILTPSGDQQMLIISESGLYSLVLTSRKPEAKRFKKWVTSEVLPTIRKTGSYSMSTAQPTHAISKNQDAVAAIMMIGTAMASWPGVRQGIVQSATLNTIELVTGYPTESFRRALPALESTEVIGSMNPTAIGKRIGKGAAWVNNGLRNAGLQVKNDRDEWVLTDAGHKYAESLPYTKNGHSGFQILWRESVIDLF